MASKPQGKGTTKAALSSFSSSYPFVKPAINRRQFHRGVLLFACYAAGCHILSHHITAGPIWPKTKIPPRVLERTTQPPRSPPNDKLLVTLQNDTSLARWKALDFPMRCKASFLASSLCHTPLAAFFPAKLSRFWVCLWSKVSSINVQESRRLRCRGVAVKQACPY